MNLCVDCHFVKRRVEPELTGRTDFYCTHDKATSQSPVTGEKVYIKCSAMRATGSCGPTGNHFERKPFSWKPVGLSSRG